MFQTNSLSVYEVAKIARRTLGRDETDTRPIPSKYLEQLLHHLKIYPKETNFLIDIEGFNGVITCLDCFEEILIGVHGKLSDFEPFWNHIESRQHKSAVQESYMQGTREDPMDVDSFDYDEYFFNQAARPNPHVHVSQPEPTNATNQRKRNTRLVVLSDGEVIEYSTDEDVSKRSPSLSNSAIQNQLASSSRLQNVAPAPAPTPIPNNSTPSQSSFPVPSKRPHRGIRKYEFGDGEVFYLSTDDETVDERPRQSPEKKPRLGGALLKSQGSINPFSKVSSTPPRPQPPPMPAKQESVPAVSQWSSLSDWNNNNNNNNRAQMGAINVPSSSNYPLQNMQRSVNPWTVAKAQYYRSPEASNPAPSPHYRHNNYPQIRIPGAFPMPQQSTTPQPYPAQRSSVGPSVVNLSVNNPYDYGMPGSMLNMGYHPPSFPNLGHWQVSPVENGSPINAPINQGEIIDPMQKFKDFFSTAMEDFQEAPKVMDAAKELGLGNTSSFLPGLEVQLMPHQLIGVSWMVEQEKKVAKGGILADDMGLGKTLQCIATCVKNQPPPGAVNKSTLVVAPAALLNQWRVEILQRTNQGLFKVHIHHGRDKLRSLSEVKEYDFVITTYQTLCLEYPKRKKLGPDGEELEQHSSDDSWDEENQRMRGPLAQTEWKTRSSKCVARLKSTYRWILTGMLSFHPASREVSLVMIYDSGTPVVNSLEDLYPQIRFLRLHPFDDWREFRHRIVSVQKNPKLAGDRAQAMLKNCLIRRTKNTKLEGKPILQLPPKEVEVVEIDFSPEERLVMIEKREQQKMTKYLKAGTVLKKSVPLPCSAGSVVNRYVATTEAGMQNEGDADGFNTVLDDADTKVQDQTVGKDDLARAEKLIGLKFVEEVKAKLLTQIESRVKAEAQGLSAEEEDTECPICYDSYINNCCITSPPNNMHAQDVEYVRAMQSGIRPCPVCRDNIHPDYIFRTKFFEPTETELAALKEMHPGLSSALDDDVSTPPVDVKGKGKGKATDDDAELDDILQDLHDDLFEPSAKMLSMIGLLKQWKQESPDDKIICYSQWTSMLDLVEKLLLKDGVDCIRYDGRMSRVERDTAVAEFRKRSGPPIMLISLKCGGVGLNLVEANRVICLDLAWNAATENQAFDRVHRMGQQKNVYVKRLIIRNTVEERILNLQANKQALSDAALGEGTAGKLKKLTVGELKATSYANHALARVY
ncbi:hypothetical protein Clacol_003117 [Clathrus columnatus]|uniref:Uncharacterized protein n=1 Tax=Clathrus columnatus TaxID=1419009 RepID=A0AAV5A2N3_9AGAM|nr:hypothetical protein Clacol_003117 [Clathrus columnatus]